MILFEQNGYRMVARKGPPDPYFVKGEAHVYSVLPGGLTARLIKDRAPIHIADLATDPSYVARRYPAITALVEGVGARTCLMYEETMTIKPTTMAAVFAAGIVLLASELTSAAGQCGPGVSDTEIKIGNTVPYSGSASALGVIGKSEAAYFAMINEQGGVNGRKISFISRDDGYSPPKTVEQVRRLVE